ncbi:hypothetical protein ACFLVK_00480, partial [Chloroflexota bacterium]
IKSEGNQPQKERAALEERQAKIMTKPLPQILDELEEYIGRVEEAVKLAQSAAGESKEAATQAKTSGEKAADAAQKAAESAVVQVKEEAARAIDALDIRVSGLESELNDLKEKTAQEALALDRAFLTLKDRHSEESPFLEGS